MTLTVRLMQVFIAVAVTLFLISFQFSADRLRVATLVIVVTLNAAPVLVLRVSGVVI